MFMGRVENADGSVKLFTGMSKRDLARAVLEIRRKEGEFFLTQVFPLAESEAAIQRMHERARSAGADVTQH